MLNLKELKEIKGDASFRKFYRNKKNHSIVVYSKKEKLKNLLIYDSINKILIKNKILAPKLLNHSYKDHLIEVEDFGDDTLFKVLKYNKTNKELIFRKILKTLERLELNDREDQFSGSPLQIRSEDTIASPFKTSYTNTTNTA